MTVVDPVTPTPAEPSLKPTRGWDTEESVAAVGIAAQAAIAWLTPNAATLPQTGVESKVE
jgi:hypothetical protein